MQDVINGFPWEHILWEKQVYKSIGDLELKVKIYKPKVIDKPQIAGAVIFFFGGGWIEGSIDHFQNQCRYLSSLGLITFTPEYRVRSRHDTTPFECVEDARDALNWIADRFDELGIDRQRVCLGGGSAGGHVALASILISAGGVNFAPRAVTLFNPVVDTTAQGYGSHLFAGKEQELSPIHHLRAGLPDMIVFHGTNDTLVPFENVRRFHDEQLKLGNVCDLIPYTGADHGFFNYGVSESSNAYFFDTLLKTETFLERTGVLARRP